MIAIHATSLQLATVNDFVSNVAAASYRIPILAFQLSLRRLHVQCHAAIIEDEVCIIECYAHVIECYAELNGVVLDST